MDPLDRLNAIVCALIMCPLTRPYVGVDSPFAPGSETALVARALEILAAVEGATLPLSRNESRRPSGALEKRPCRSQYNST
jgi:hypothetical protein